MAKPPAKKAPAKKLAAKKVPAKKAAPKTLGAKPGRKRKVTDEEAVKPESIDLDAASAPDSDLMGLTPREANFFELYLATHRVGASYVEAGFTAKNANVASASGSQLLNGARGRAYIAKRTREMFSRLEESQDRLIKTTIEVAYADPNDLVEYRRGSCRHCWGVMNRYQYTAGEWDAALERHNTKREALIEKGRPDIGPLETKGGVGYDFRRDPNEDCPECSGMGTGRTIIKDTRNLSPGARSLYAGMKEGKDGLQALMHSQEKARDMLAKLLKLTEDNTTVNITFDAPTLEAEYAKTMQAAHDRMMAMRESRRKARDGEPG
jgi:phage terminase small subunit